MEADNGMASLKYGEREDCQPRILHLEKYSFENKGEKIFLDKQKLRKILHEQIYSYIKRNATRNSSYWRKVISKGNLDWQKRTRRPENGKYLGKYKELHFSLNFKILLNVQSTNNNMF